MQTPKEWSENLKKNVITEEMLGAAAYSVNKRAKNCRDKKREYKHKYDLYHNAEKYEEKENEYYRQKETLLSIVRPVCIHCEHQGFERQRHYDYEQGFFEDLARCLPAGTICWSNSYTKGGYRDWDDWGEWYGGTTTYFFDELLLDKEQTRYYLYYALEDHTYHRPIDEKDVEKYKEKYGIEVQHIGFLDTSGRDIAELASPAFVKKLIALIQTGQYTYIENPDRQTPTYDDAYKNEGLSQQAAWSNICGAIEFGWSKVLSGHIEQKVLQKIREMGNTSSESEARVQEMLRIREEEVRNINSFYAKKQAASQEALASIEDELKNLQTYSVGVSKKAKRKLLKKIKKEKGKFSQRLPMPQCKEKSKDFVKQFLVAKESPVDVRNIDDLAGRIAEFFDSSDAIFPRVEQAVRISVRQAIEESVKEKYLTGFAEKFEKLRREAEYLHISY